MDKVFNCNGQSEWLNICVDCGRRVITHGSELPGQCPECHGWRWLCHLRNPAEEETLLSTEGDQNTTPEFCPPKNNTIVAKSLMDKKHMRPTYNEDKRGRPPATIPDDLIRQLSNEGWGSIRIAGKLQEMGIVVSYKTIQRRLQASLL